MHTDYNESKPTRKCEFQKSNTVLPVQLKPRWSAITANRPSFLSASSCGSTVNTIIKTYKKKHHQNVNYDINIFIYIQGSNTTGKDHILITGFLLNLNNIFHFKLLISA